MVEVLVAALLIFLALTGILSMNTRSIHLLRATKHAVASSQMLQQRIETIRDKPWPEISNATALAAVMRVPTDSEKELADSGCTEFISVSVPDALGGERQGSRAFTLQRKHGVVRIDEDGDLGKESMLLVSVSLQWRDVHRPLQRTLRTVVCRTGLTRSGIFGSTVGRPAAAAPR
jgi:hypothetical protein